ncbi:MAG: hypothetical protein K8H75_00860, partial [Sulfuricella sp.]|nr:hypothetical protein [Sulfuricella sp.]
MALTNLHTDWTQGSYEQDRDLSIKISENDKLLVGNLTYLKPYFDPNAKNGGSIAIGYGFDLLVNSNAQINTYLAAAGLGSLSTLDAQLLDQARSTHTTPNITSIVSQLTLNLGSEPNATKLLDAYITKTAEGQVTNFLTGLGITWGPTKERAALVSLAYNTPGLLGIGLARALVDDNRAEAWYQIRYQSNGGDSKGQGIANRRYRESDMFGLYDNAPLGESEARQVYRMYTQHSDPMINYDALYGGSASLETSLNPAAQLLINTYAPGKSFSNLNIWVGESTGSTLTGVSTNANLMIGDAGSDTLTGGSGNDVLVGGSGKDTLIGAAGNDTLNGLDGQGGDTLAGGIGDDTYYADNGDIIDDEDGIGTVYVGQSRTRLLGGERKADESLYTSADKSQVYRENSNGSIDVWTADGHVTIQPSPGNPGPRAQPTSDGSPGVQSGQPGMGLPLISPKPKDPPFNPPYAGAGDAVCPLILDLDGNGVQVTNLADGVYFDHDGNGFVESTAWVGGGDGLLAWDKNNDGKITTGNELFGDRTLMKNGRWGQNGFDVLVEYDDNQDGKIDANDAIWSNLQLWVDANHNGISSAAELHSLSEFGIQSINTAYVSEQEIDGITQRGSYTKTDGSQANAVDDRRFVADFVDTKVRDWVPVTPEIEALPDIQGYGNVYDLRQAMARDASGELMNLVKQFGSASNTAAREELLTQILFKWTDSDQIDPHSRDNLNWGTSFDGRKLAVLEKFNGVPFFQPYAETGPDANPIWEAIPLLDQSYSALFGMMYSQLMAQTHLKWLYDKITFAWDEASQSVKANQNSVVDALVNLLATDRPKGIETIREYAQSLVDSPLSSVMDIGYFTEVLVPQGEDVSGALEEVIDIAFPGENIVGDEGDNALVGSLGADVITGRGGNDTLVGGYGKDYLFGEDGDDILDSGSGDDYLNGGSGNDTYLFGRGYGQDTISEYDTTAGNSDTIRLATDVTPNDVSMGRNASDLFISINGTNDKITVQNWFSDPAYRVERIEFSDGTVWDASIMQAAIFRGTDAADYIYGTPGNEVIEGLGGDDYLTGGEGDDTLDGGTGNDTLDGGTGNDTYLFGRGYGQDTLSDYDATAGNIDTIRLAAGISASDVTLSRDASSLYL